MNWNAPWKAPRGRITTGFCFAGAWRNSAITMPLTAARWRAAAEEAEAAATTIAEAITALRKPGGR